MTSGSDPIAAELKSTYGTSDIYGMHWLADVDNKYGFGATPGAGCELGPTATGTSYINTFQRGAQESVWETVPQPVVRGVQVRRPERLPRPVHQDAVVREAVEVHQRRPTPTRAPIEAVYWANQWATAQGKQARVAGDGRQGRQDG